MRRRAASVGTVQLQLNNFSTRRLFRPRSEWGHYYPSGDGQKLNLALQLNGSDYSKVSFSFLEPWLGRKKPHSLGISTAYTLFSNSESDYKKPDFFSFFHRSWAEDELAGRLFSLLYFNFLYIL